jgi:hypothetical protein
MKRRLGQAGRGLGEALHQLARIAELLLVLVVAAVCLLGYRLSVSPIEMPYLASKLATAASGKGITIQVQQAELTWAGYHQGGAVPFGLQLGGIVVRSGAGLTLATIPTAHMVFSFASLLNNGTPLQVSSTQARFSGADAPVSMLASIWFGRHLTLSGADIDVTMGAGSLGLAPNAVAVRSGHFHLDVTPAAVLLSDGRLALAPEGKSAPQIGFSGQAALDGQWQGSLTATVDVLQAQDIGAYWPPALVPLSRQWVTQNITAGTARNASFTVDMTAPENLASVNVSNVTGGFSGENVTLIWIPKTVPITGLSGTFTMENRDAALIKASTGQLGGVVMQTGQMLITGMSTPHQVGYLNVVAQGKIADAIAILAPPPLSLLRGAPPQVSQATGDATITVAATIPFLIVILPQDVDLHVDAALSNVAMPSTISGLGFSGGTGQLLATTADLHVKAQAQFAGEPAVVTVASSFDPRNTTVAFDLTSRAGPLLLQRFGLDTPDAVSGAIGGLAPYALHVTGDFAATQTARLTADLTQASFSLPRLGWAKKAGTPGQLAVTATLNNGNLTSLQTLNATAPELDIQGTVQNGQLLLPVLAVGRTRGQGIVTPPSGTDPDWLVQLSGSALDLRVMPQGKASTAPPPPPGPAVPPTGPTWRAALNFQQLYLAAAPAPGAGALIFTGNGMGGTLLRGQLSAGDVTLAVTPLNLLQRDVRLQTADTGALLRSLGSYGGMQGGVMSLDAIQADGAPMTGTLTLTDFRISQAPAFTKIMEALTIYGLSAAASGPGMAFSQAVVPFTLEDGALILHEARAYSASLGFTASGSIPLNGGNADVSTTIVPAYALNTLPGRIPLIGGLFSAEKGGGLFAARATISGPLGDPDVRLNPLSAITPGFLRDLFGFGRGGSAAQ